MSAVYGAADGFHLPPSNYPGVQPYSDPLNTGHPSHISEYQPQMMGATPISPTGGFSPGQYRYPSSVTSRVDGSASTIISCSEGSDLMSSVLSHPMMGYGVFQQQHYQQQQLAFPVSAPTTNPTQCHDFEFHQERQQPVTPMNTPNERLHHDVRVLQSPQACPPSLVLPDQPVRQPWSTTVTAGAPPHCDDFHQPPHTAATEKEQHKTDRTQMVPEYSGSSRSSCSAESSTGSDDISSLSRTLPAATLTHQPGPVYAPSR